MGFTRHCYYVRNKSGYFSGCGYRAAYNKYWKFCPYCGTRIMVLDKDALGQEEEILETDETDETQVH